MTRHDRSLPTVVRPKTGLHSSSYFYNHGFPFTELNACPIAIPSHTWPPHVPRKIHDATADHMRTEEWAGHPVNGSMMLSSFPWSCPLCRLNEHTIVFPFYGGSELLKARVGSPDGLHTLFQYGVWSADSPVNVLILLTGQLHKFEDIGLVHMIDIWW